MTSTTALRLAAIALVLFVETANATETYRWVDDNGMTHYSDQVPPEAAKKRRARLNAQGQEVAVIEAAKTREQLQQEQELKLLRERQGKILAEQRDRDLSLLRTYRNAPEIFVALQAKIDTLDGNIKITEVNRQRQKDQLANQQQRAAELERQGQPVPDNLRELIESTRRQIATYDLKLQELQNDKFELAVRFTKDAARYEALQKEMQNYQGSTSGLLSAVTHNMAISSGGNIISAIACGTEPVCAKAWQLAKEYIQKNSALPLSLETEKILQTAPPRTEDEFGITVTRIAEKMEYILFLDLRCRPSSIGEQACSSARAKEVRTNFKVYIEAGLGSLVLDNGALPTPVPSR